MLIHFPVDQFLLLTRPAEVHTLVQSGFKRNSPGRDSVSHLLCLTPLCVTLSGMETADILALIEAEIAKLLQARALIADAAAAKKGPGRPKSAAVAPVKPKKKKRNITPEGRAKIAAAVKTRWEKQRKAEK
jgi:hypothetical protein